jgi:Mg-chelatase subunit ChlD
MRTALAVMSVMLLGGLAVAQPKPREPVSIVFVVDRSGSMQGPKLTSSKDGVLEAIKQLAETDNVAVVAFDSAATVVVPLEDAKANPARDKKVADIKAGGGTDALPAIEAAWNQLAATKTKKKHVIFLTDGEFSSDGIESLLKKMQVDRVSVSTIGLAGSDENMLGLIANVGAGRFHKVPDVALVAKTIAKEAQTFVTGK